MGEEEAVESPNEQPTCGKGLAEHAAVPAKMAGFLASLAENLEAHVPTIDTGDAHGRREREAYVHLASEYAAVAARLAVTAERMRGCRDLPPAHHHEEALTEPGILTAFERFVALELELADLLRASAERDQRALMHLPGAQE